MLFDYQTRFAWLSLVIPLLAAELGFFLCDLGQVLASLWAQQSGCQKDAGSIRPFSTQTLITQVVI